MKNIAFIPTTNYPIPAVKGGAIETLVTALILENEKNKKYKFTVFSIYDSLIESNYANLQNTDVVFVPHDIFLVNFCFRVYNKILVTFNKRYVRKSCYMTIINHYLAKNKFDLIIFESSQNEVLQAKIPHESKCVYHVHADYLSKNTFGIDEVFKKCDEIWGVSDFITNKLQSVNSHTNTRFRTLLNAVDIEFIRKGNSFKTKRSIREIFNISNDDVLIIYCSRLSPEKGIKELIEAVLKINNCKLLIVGGENFSSSKITPYVQTLYDLVKDNSDKVFFSGYIEHKFVYDYMKAADIAVIPSICNEAAPLTLLEFRACQLCVIASNRGGIPEYFDKDCGLLVDNEPDFVENLRTCIEKCLDSKYRCEKSLNAQKGLDIFSYNSYYKRFSQLVCDIVIKTQNA